MKAKVHFPVELIDFRVKRLGLTHDPKATTTQQGGTFNEIAEALVKFKQSFIPKSKEDGTI